MSVAQVLENALGHICQYGWCQGKYGTAGQPTCIVGAVIWGNPTETPGRYAALDFLIREFTATTPRQPRCPIVAWNDAAGLTQEQVERKLIELIAKAKKQGL